MDKIKRIQIGSMTRRRNQLGRFAVPCMVSDRWNEFAPSSGGHFQDGEFIPIDVMTDTSGNSRKICSLIVAREDLMRVLDLVKSPS